MNSTRHITKTKKYIHVFLLLIIFSFVSCNAKSQLQSVTNTSSKQSSFIENTLLEQLSFKCKEVKKTDEKTYAILENMDDEYESYEIINEEDKKYLLILRTSDKDIICVLDESNELVFGLIDNGIPKYFE